MNSEDGFSAFDNRNDVNVLRAINQGTDHLYEHPVNFVFSNVDQELLTPEHTFQL